MKPAGISENAVEAFRFYRPHELFECLIVCFEFTGPDDRVVVAVEDLDVDPAEVRVQGGGGRDGHAEAGGGRRVEGVGVLHQVNIPLAGAIPG